MSGYHWDVEWDPGKAASNLAKHGISFQQAATVLLDSLAITIPDDTHSEEESRWITLGLCESGPLLVVIHTVEETSPRSAIVRIISARRANRKEMRDYEQDPA